jgi:UDP-N-acetylmuramate--alanine ligase
MVQAHLLHGRRAAFLLGIEGVGMSGAAELLLARGLSVHGADRALGERAGRLRGLGLEVQLETTSLPDQLDLVVASAAIPADHPRLVEARQRGIETWKYAQLLGALMADRDAICIAGCHGKTTTTSLAAACLLHGDRDPTFVIGGALRSVGTGARSGSGRHFVAEACEFDRSFHHHVPRIAVVLNVDEDHLDYYADLAEIEEAYRVFAARAPRDGHLVVHESCAEVFRGDARIRAPLETYGVSEQATWRVEILQISDRAHETTFNLHHGGASIGELRIPLVGGHNAQNAAAAAIALLHAGLGFDEIARGLGAFPGVGRRLERIHESGGVTVLDDYGHHPTEISATIRALRLRYPGRRLVLVFQPHQASRTRVLLEALAQALATADVAWIPPIYFARDSEEDQRMVTSEDLAERIVARGGRALAFPGLRAVIEHGRSGIRPGDVLVTMGAGDVDEVARGLADLLR